MKKKLIQILMCAVVAVTMGAFVSCKDTNADEINDLQAQVTKLNAKLNNNDDLTDVLKKQVQNLSDLIDALQKKVDAIKSCNCNIDAAIDALRKELQAKIDEKADEADVKALEQRIQAIETTYVTTTAMQTYVQAEIDKLESVYATKEELSNEIDNEIDKLKSIYVNKTDLQTELNKYVTKTELATAVSELETKITEAKSAADAADKRADEAQKAADAAQKDATQALQDAQKAQADATQALKDAQNAQADATQALKDADAAQKAADAAQKAADAANALAEANQKVLDAYTPKVDELITNFATISTDVAKLQIDVQTAIGQAQINASAIDALEKRVSTNEQTIQALDNAVKTLTSDLATTNTNVATLTDKLNDLIDNRIAKMEQDIKENASAISALDTKVTNLQAASEAADAALQKEIDEVKDDLEEVKQQVLENTTKILEMMDILDKLQETIANMVTGIIVQGTSNPWFGSVNLPFNISSNILIAFHGTATDNVYFPSATGYGPYAATAGNVELTEKDMQMIAACNSELAVNESRPYIKGSRPLFDGLDGRSSAGQIYMTINPNTVNCTGLQLNLENSQAKESGILLAPLTKTNRTLQFGYSRAADNGFYQATAYVDASSIDKVQKVNLHTDMLQSNGKQIVNIVKESIEKRSLQLTKSDLLSMANDMRDLVEGVRLDANAVRCPWTDGEGVQHNVYSEYKVAATAIQPLSFETFKDFHYQTVPGYEQVYNFVEKLADKITGKVHSSINGMEIFKGLVNLQEKGEGLLFRFKNEPIQNVDFDEVKKTIEFDVEFVITDPTHQYEVVGDEVVLKSNHSAVLMQINGLYKGVEKGDYLIVSVHKVREVSDIYDEISGNLNNRLDEVRDQIDAIVDFLDQTNKVLNQVFDLKDHILGSMDDYSDKAVNKIQSILSKANTIVVSQINELNSRLQPVLLYSADSQSGLLATKRVAPTTVSAGTLTLIPTTWTMEFAAPTCRKHVAVTNVFKGGKSAQDGNAACLSVLKAANNGGKNINKRLDGDTHVVTIENLQSGYTYEIAYSALDYSGKIAARKYYVTVK